MFPFRRLIVRRRVVINLISGRAVSGVVTAKRGPLLEVADATVLEPDGDPRPVDGSVVIERGRVEFIQRLS